MNILGIGTLELIVICVISFIVLGPDRLVQTARFLGKLFGDIRRISSEIPELVGRDDFLANNTKRETKHRDADSELSQESKTQYTTEQVENDEDHPIAFRPMSETEPETRVEQEPKKDTD